MIHFQLRSRAILMLLVASGMPFAAKGEERGDRHAGHAPQKKARTVLPLEPDEAAKTFRLPPGFRIEPVATEPMIENPVVLQFDPDGRAWVLEMRGFMPNADGVGEDKPVGRVSILEDTDGDGRMDRGTVFLDSLVLPRALLLVKGGILLCEPPALWFYPNENDRPGPRVLVANDFAVEGDPKRGKSMSIEHTGNSLVRNLDNWIYSLYHSYRYRQAGDQWIREPMPRRAQWGLAQDDFGRLFYTSNSDQLRGDMVPSHYFSARQGTNHFPGIGLQVAHNQSVWPGRVNPGVNRAYEPDVLRPDGTLAKFTAACGTCIYRADLFGPEFQGNAFVCEASANLVRRNILSEKEGRVTARNAYEKTEFLTSSDEIFRPVNVHIGPDGALYIVDMYHGIIQHRVYLSSYLRAHAEERGLEKVTNYGRIWRVIPEGKTPGPRPNLSHAASEELANTLSHPNGWWRDTAQRLLVERNDPSVVPALEKLAVKAAKPVTRLHALWSLEGMGRLSPETIRAALDDSNPRVRAAGIRLSEPLLKQGGPSTNCALVRNQVMDLASDPSAEVQIQLALSLGLLSSDANAREVVIAMAKDSPVALARDAAKFSLANEASSKTNPAPAAKAAPLTPEQKKRFEAGQGVFEMTCLACHQQHGLGQAGLAPPLVGSEWVAGSDKRLIRIVLNGLRGPIKVKGEIFELEMPALGILDDDQIAAVLTYVRREWGHTFDPVEPAGVKAVRDETSTREDAWTMPELLKVP